MADRWACPECGDEAVCTVSDYAEIGTPWCADCDCEMELEEEGVAEPTTFDLVLRVPAKNVGDVADRLRNGFPAVVEDYDKQLADNYGTEGSIALVEVVERPRSVVVRVSGPDIRVNVVSRAVASVVGYDLGVKYPEWG